MYLRLEHYGFLVCQIDIINKKARVIHFDFCDGMYIG